MYRPNLPFYAVRHVLGHRTTPPSSRADASHLTTHTCDTWQHVLAFCTHYDGISVF